MHHTSHKLKFRTAYSQFYLCDKNTMGTTDSPGFWTEEAFADKLAVEAGILGVCIGTYSYVKCEVFPLAYQPNETNFEPYDQVVEGSLEIKSGVLQVLDCPDSTVIMELTVAPGFYRVRIKATGLDSVVDEDLEADDTYLIEVWPATIASRQVLKKYPYSY